MVGLGMISIDRIEKVELTLEFAFDHYFYYFQAFALRKVAVKWMFMPR